MEEIGRGTYGTVYKVRSRLDHNLYVAKQIVLRNSKSARRKRGLAEALLLRDLDHPFIVKYYTSFIQNESLYIIMEFAERGDLYKLYKRHRRKQRPFPERVLWKFAYEMGTALDYLHDNRIIHRDLKCLNVFLGADKRIKIGDLGVSKILGDDELLHTQAGTPAFFAPELVRKKPYDYKVDVWGLGCILYQLAALRPPFEGVHVFELADNIVHSDPPVLSNFYSESFRNLVFKLLDKNPNKRISVKNVLQSIPATVLSTVLRSSLQDTRSQGVSHASMYDSTNSTGSNWNLSSLSSEESNTHSKSRDGITWTTTHSQGTWTPNTESHRASGPPLGAPHVLGTLGSNFVGRGSESASALSSHSRSSTSSHNASADGVPSFRPTTEGAAREDLPEELGSQRQWEEYSFAEDVTADGFERLLLTPTPTSSGTSSPSTSLLGAAAPREVKVKQFHPGMLDHKGNRRASLPGGRPSTRGGQLGQMHHGKQAPELHRRPTRSRLSPDPARGSGGGGPLPPHQRPASALSVSRPWYDIQYLDSSFAQRPQAAPHQLVRPPSSSSTAHPLWSAPPRKSASTTVRGDSMLPTRPLSAGDSAVEPRPSRGRFSTKLVTERPHTSHSTRRQQISPAASSVGSVRSAGEETTMEGETQPPKRRPSVSDFRTFRSPSLNPPAHASPSAPSRSLPVDATGFHSPTTSFAAQNRVPSGMSHHRRASTVSACAEAPEAVGVEVRPSSRLSRRPTIGDLKRGK